MIDIICQVAIFILGLGAIWVVGWHDPKKRRYGYLLGLCSQPFWFYTLYVNEQWILLVAALGYTWSWINGLRNHWATAAPVEGRPE